MHHHACLLVPALAVGVVRIYPEQRKIVVVVIEGFQETFSWACTRGVAGWHAHEGCQLGGVRGGGALPAAPHGPVLFPNKTDTLSISASTRLKT